MKNCLICGKELKENENSVQCKQCENKFAEMYLGETVIEEEIKIPKLYTEEEVLEIMLQVWVSCKDDEGESFAEIKERLFV